MDPHLDIFGQQPFFTINIQVCFCFSLPIHHEFSKEGIVEKLNLGLERLYESFPWLAAEVENQGSGHGDTGVYKFKSLRMAPRVVVKDLTETPSIPTMDDLRRAKFPMHMLDENMVAPRKIFEDDRSMSAPVFLVQASFITGGLLLTFVAQHNTMDITGLGQVIRLFSQACHGEQFSQEDVLYGNLPRRDIVPLLEDSRNPGPDFDRYLINDTPNLSLTPNDSLPTPSNTWATLYFSPGSLASLKSLAMSSTTSAPFVSTDDALTAFIWQSVARARLPRVDPSRESTIMRAVDVRQHLGIPKNYPGFIQSNAYSTNTMQSLANESLSSVASQLRGALRQDLGYHTREIATFLTHTADKSVFSFAAKLDTSVDILLSSWAKVDCLGVDFNLGLGWPEAMRKPNCKEIEGLIFFLPKTREGAISVAISLRDEDMDRLKADLQVSKFAEYIG